MRLATKELIEEIYKGHIVRRDAVFTDKSSFKTLTELYPTSHEMKLCDEFYVDKTSYLDYSREGWEEITELKDLIFKIADKSLKLYPEHMEEENMRLLCYKLSSPFPDEIILGEEDKIDESFKFMDVLYIRSKMRKVLKEESNRDSNRL